MVKIRIMILNSRYKSKRLASVRIHVTNQNGWPLFEFTLQIKTVGLCSNQNGWPLFELSQLFFLNLLLFRTLYIIN